jgi:hypothetical protein
LPALAPLREQQVKAEIAQPKEGARVPANATVKVHGAAWSSDADIAKVEISVDSGASWQAAHLLGSSVKNAWRLWEYDWQTPAEAGKRKLLARATDSLGRAQPFERDADCGTYMINHVLPIEVEVR